MEKALLISNLLLWIVILLQLALFVVFAKLVVQFLNGFRAKAEGKFESAALQAGDKAPMFWEKDQYGVMQSLEKNDNKYTLLLFISETCGICEKILRQLPQIDFAEKNLRLFVVSTASLGPKEDLVKNYPFLKAGDLFQAYRVNALPTGVLISPEWRIVSMSEIPEISKLYQLLGNVVNQAS
ncbi:redoxin domain-containing protein [Brevibacillus reuszeri]|uniref:redoxin domain-containing protein n=1 Tax=Brevibacillus reuszeri TaxID=54915 RepID=UPI000CCC9903|nr:redoxin domain-containing protein [Brevibacillus reuszeri]